MLDRLRQVDLQLLLPALFILAFGWLMVTSAAMDRDALRSSGFGMFYHSIKHLAFIGVGLTAGLITLLFPTSFWERYSGWLLFVCVAMLLLLIVPGIGLGQKVNGSTRWFRIAGFGFQPAEFTKLVFVMYMARYITRFSEYFASQWQTFIRPLALLALVFVLLLLQPDFGSVIVMATATLVMLFVGNAKLSHLCWLGMAAVVGAIILVQIAPYRFERFQDYFAPFDHPYDGGYQLVQALIAIGRGGLFGTGLGESIQKLLYLPEAHTDFVFAIMAEELGLAGALVLLGLFGFLLTRALRIAKTCFDQGDSFNGLFALGISVLLFLQLFVNVAVNIGLLPTKGLTLPLVSYGGTSMLMSCVAIALLLRIALESQQTPKRRKNAK